MWLILIFLAVPILEIALFIQVGGLIGLWPTLAIIVLTALGGTALMRAEGIRALRDLRLRLDRGGNPVGPIANGAVILVAGVLLVSPGFFTDTIGLLLLVPPIRAWVIAWAGKRIVIKAANRTTRPRGVQEAIVADYEVLDDEPRNPGGRSGWTRPEG